MKNSPSKGKTKVADVVDEIIQLRASIQRDTDRLKLLESIMIPDATPEPKDFDYKEAIMGLFNENPNVFQNVDSIVSYIQTHYNFVPNRETASLRVGYLVDTAKKLERVEGKRGMYRLKAETPNSQEQGVG